MKPQDILSQAADWAEDCNLPEFAIWLRLVGLPCLDGVVYERKEAYLSLLAVVGFEVVFLTPLPLGQSAWRWTVQGWLELQDSVQRYHDCNGEYWDWQPGTPPKLVFDFLAEALASAITRK